MCSNNPDELEQDLNEELLNLFYKWKNKGGETPIGYDETVTKKEIIDTFTKICSEVLEDKLEKPHY